jgi:hypothetical protein
MAYTEMMLLVFDKATKKAGWDLPPEADKKITDAAKNMFSSFG